MAWVRLDDSFSEHPKLARAGPLGMAMQIAALCYANRNLTDGFVPRAVAPLLLNFDGLYIAFPESGLPEGQEGPLAVSWQAVAESLVRAGLWEEENGGYRIHDYLKYQPSRESVMRAREGSAKRAKEFRQRRRQEEASEGDGGASPGDLGCGPSGVPARAGVAAGAAGPRAACWLDAEETQEPARGRDAPSPGRPEEPALDEILARHPRYDGHQADMIRDYWDVVRFTRKSGRIAGTVIAREMDYWERFGEDIVIAALKIHIRKYQGKDEKYTEGIMRRLEKERERGGLYGGGDAEPKAPERAGANRPGAGAADSRYAEYDAVWRGP